MQMSKWNGLMFLYVLHTTLAKCKYLGQYQEIRYFDFLEEKIILKHDFQEGTMFPNHLNYNNFKKSIGRFHSFQSYLLYCP